MNVHLYPSSLENETRILKIVRSLRANGVFDKIGVLGRDGTGLPGHEDLGDGIHLFRLAPAFGGTFGKWVRTVGWYVAVLGWMRGRRVECLNCHSLPVLPLSVLLKLWKRCILVYDTHELETETHVTTGLRKYLAKFVEKIFIRNVDAVCVVNRSIASWYQTCYRLPRVWVVHNMPHRMVQPPKQTGLLRDAIGLDSPEGLLFIYQGVLSPGRGIEVLLDAFADINHDRHLVCMGYGPLEKTVRDAEQMHSNIHFMPAVAPELVREYTVDADVGLALIENTCLSYYFCAPNKMYEYASSGVAVVVSEFPEMIRFVDAFDCGWKVKPDVASLRGLLESIDADSLAFKRSNAMHAGTVHCWENEEVELLSIYKYLGFGSINVIVPCLIGK